MVSGQCLQGKDSTFVTVTYIYFKSDKILDFRLQIRYTKSALSVADFFGGVLSDEFKSKTANRN